MNDGRGADFFEKIIPTYSLDDPQEQEQQPEHQQHEREDLAAAANGTPYITQSIARTGRSP